MLRLPERTLLDPRNWIDRVKDIEDRQQIWLDDQCHAASRAALRFHDAGISKTVQNLPQIGCVDSRFLGNDPNSIRQTRLRG